MTHVTCRLAAKNRDQLWNPTLGAIEYGLTLPLPFMVCVEQAAGRRTVSVQTDDAVEIDTTAISLELSDERQRRQAAEQRLTLLKVRTTLNSSLCLPSRL